MLRWSAGAATVAAPAPSPPTPSSPHAPSRSGGRRRLLLRPCLAKKPVNDERAAGGSSSVFSKSLLLRSSVALFALGFVDAGYSGDWSRIGAISRDTEELLKLGAYVVVPLCLALIFSVSEDSKDKS
ncbi:hypothetical protein ACP70R_016691 [Stipagrostis hirtigluma subsp. patula]